MSRKVISFIAPALFLLFAADSYAQNAAGGINQTGPNAVGTVINNNFGAVTKKLPKIDVVNTTYPGNEDVIKTLRNNDGKTVYLDKINMDLVLDENYAVMKNCFPGKGSRESIALEMGHLNGLQLPIPERSFKKQNTCWVFLEINSDDKRPYKVSSGGTGTVYYLVRKNFLVNMQLIGSQTIFDLREVSK